MCNPPYTLFVDVWVMFFEFLRIGAAHVSRDPVVLLFLNGRTCFDCVTAYQKRGAKVGRAFQENFCLNRQGLSWSCSRCVAFALFEHLTYDAFVVRGVSLCKDSVVGVGCRSSCQGASCEAAPSGRTSCSWCSFAHESGHSAMRRAPHVGGVPLSF